jgi:hypothetical protein
MIPMLSLILFLSPLMILKPSLLLTSSQAILKLSLIPVPSLTIPTLSLILMLRLILFSPRIRNPMTKVRGKRSGYAGTRVGLFNVSSSSNVINHSLLLMHASILLIRMRAMHEDHCPEDRFG